MCRISTLIVLVALPLAACNSMQHADRDEEGNEVKVSIDQVPAAARSTLQQQAPGVAIASVDKETAHGMTVYEADAMISGKNYEIVVGEDGHLVSKKLDNEADEKGGEEKEEKN